jgi:Peptidase family M50
MRELRRTLAWSFAFASLLVLWGIADYLLYIVRSSHARLPSAIVFTALLSGLLGIATLFGVAAWTILQEKASARVWGIVASLLPLLMCFAVLYRWPRHIAAIPWVSLTVGVAGLFAFSRRDLTAGSGEPSGAHPRIPGDGTHPLIDKAIWIAGAAGFISSINWWWRWARSEDLVRSPAPSFFLQVILACLIATLVHECGHALVGMALGMKLRAFMIGPFQWRNREGKWEFQFHPAGFLSAGGATAVVPTTPQYSRSYQLCMIAAGPFASLVTGVIAFCAALSAPDHPWEQAWLLLALIATVSLLAAALNLIPFRTKTAYSDGAFLYQLLSGGPWADFHRALSIVGSTCVTPLRPRDYDIEAINRAAACIAYGQGGLLLRLLAFSYYFDHGRNPEASHALDQAAKVYEESASDIPAELHTVFIFGKSFVQRDAAGARLWWERMEAKKPTRFNGDYWMARTALLWSENRLDEAQQAWHKGYVLAQQLPKAGAYDSDRDRFTLLRQALDESLSADLAQDVPATTG